MPRAAAALPARRALAGCLRIIGWLVVLAGIAAPAAPVEEHASKRVFVVYAADNAYPYSYREGSGPVEGFSVDLLDAVGRVMNAEVQRVSLPADDARVRFSKGGADFEQMLTIFPGREQYAEYSVPYLVLKGALFVRTGDKRFQSVEDLRRQHAVIAAPDQGYQFALDSGISHDYLVKAPAEECIEELARGHVDAVLVSRLTGLSEAHHRKLAIEAVGPPIEGFTMRFCFAAHKGDTKLVEELNEALAVVHQSGEFTQIYQKWFEQLEPAEFTREQVIVYVAAALAVGLGLALWGLLRQGHLRRRVTAQSEELAESRAFLAEAQRFARIGHWQYRDDREPFAVWSEETFRIMGKDARQPVPTLEQAAGVLFEQDRAKWIQSIEQAWKNGIPFNIDVVIEPDRGVVRTVNARGRPLRGPGDAIVGVFGVLQDVTTWRAAEMALRESEQLLRALYDNMPQALGVVERRRDVWEIVSLNPAASHLLATSGSVSSSRLEFAHLGLVSDGPTDWQKILNACAASKTPVKMDAQSADGRKALALTLVPLERDSVRPRCCFLVEDVSERMQKDAEIAQGRRLRAIGELVGGIAHEFNNLLTPILMKAEQLQDDWKAQPELSSDLRIISDAAKRSAELTRRLLTFGRKDEGRPELIHLPELIRNNVDFLRNTIDRRIRIDVQIPANLPQVFLSGWDLHQILLNLLLNARDSLIEKLGRSDGRTWDPCIWISAASKTADTLSPFASGRSRPVGWVTLTIRDNGGGMPKEVLERIFEPFFTTKPVGSGTGLGLATTYHIVTEFGGRIDVESKDGEGASFHVSIPVTVETTEPFAYPEPPKPPPPRPGAQGLRVLLADDEETIARLMLKLLKNRGHAATAVGSGKEAWALISEHPLDYDAIVMDLNMPGLTGLELARKLPGSGYKGAMIVMTGRVTEEDAAELTRLGVAAVIMKPFTIEEFLEAFANATRKG